MRLQLLSKELAKSGGIKTSVDLLVKRLCSSGLDAFISSKVEEADLYWAHGYDDRTEIRKVINSQKKLWVHIHDYKFICLTGRKMYGNDREVCHRSHSLCCFSQHVIKGCGKGKNPFNLLKRYFSNQKTLELYKKSHKVTVFSDFVYDQLVLNGFSSSKIIKIDPIFKIPTKEYKSGLKRKKILWVGRIVKEKGILDFLEILANLKDKNFDFTAEIIGEGTLKNEVKEILINKKLKTQVKLTDWCSAEQLNKKYQSSHVLVFNPNWPEPFGLVGLEALSNGIEVLVLNRGGILSWARNRDGVKVFETHKEIENYLASKINEKKIINRDLNLSSLDQETSLKDLILSNI